MSEKNRPTTAGATELKEEDLDKIQGGGLGTNGQNFKVEIEGVTQGAVKGTRGKKA